MNRKQIEAEIYNNKDKPSNRPKWGEQWDNELMSIVLSEHERRCKELSQKYVQGENIVILGGSVSEARLLFNKHKKIVVVNISQKELEDARKEYPKNTEFILGDAENTHLKSNSFDVVICHSSLHHLNIKAAISEIKRSLKKGSVLFYGK